MNRKMFIKSGIIGFSGLVTMPVFGTNISPVIANNQMDPKKIKEFVVAGHNNLDKVKSMLENDPNLIYARHDWGGGDFEEAIEGAGHVGNKDIANYLISKGARVNLFVLTMLGNNELVIPILEAYPNLIQTKGPHGFSLLHHAKVGGKDSRKILDYLRKKGLDESKFRMK